MPRKRSTNNNTNKNTNNTIKKTTRKKSNNTKSANELINELENQINNEYSEKKEESDDNISLDKSKSSKPEIIPMNKLCRTCSYIDDCPQPFYNIIVRCQYKKKNK